MESIKVSSSESEIKINSQEEFIREAEKNVYQIILEEPKVIEEKKAVKEGFLKKLFHFS